MRLLLIFILVISTTQLSAQNALKFNGYYYVANVTVDSSAETSDTTWNYMRFYKDGSVVDVSVNAAPGKLISFIRKNNSSVFQGKYIIKGDKIEFSTAGKQPGKIMYKGKIAGNTLYLHMNSLITKYQADQEYTFVLIKGLQ